MFKDLYKKANDSITDEELKQKILNPKPIKKHSFVPAYSYGTILAAALALVVYFTNKAPAENTPMVVKNTPVQYEYQGEKFVASGSDASEKAKTAEEKAVILADTEDLAIAEMAVNEPAFIYRGRYDDILYNTATEDVSYALSPFSLENAISVALNGGDAETENAIVSAFNMGDVKSQNQKMQSIIKQYRESEKTSINIANSVWINKDRTDARFNPDFETAVFNSYSAESHTVDSSQAVNTINNWVSSNTNGKINGIISDNSFDGLVVNTVYFKGSFVNKFNKNLTKPDTFTGNGVKYERDFMEQTSYLSYGKSGDIEIVKLPYEKDNVSVSMFILMGNERVTNPVSLIENTPLESTYINLKMPKFEYSYQTSLMPALANMGIENMTFSKMTDKPLSTFDIIQKTYINTDEEGTEAAAATAILMGSAAPTEKPIPYELKIDKDFTFVIYDETNNIALFTGEIK